ncbi:hypothetical protein ATERTT37_005158 [Aspergillus terreus]
MRLKPLILEAQRFSGTCLPSRQVEVRFEQRVPTPLIVELTRGTCKLRLQSPNLEKPFIELSLDFMPLILSSCEETEDPLQCRLTV